MPHHLAVLNVARMRAPMQTPVMAGFVDRLDAINAVADAAPGFVWRLADEDPNDPALVSLGPLMLVNMSVWEGLESLRAYVYRSAHVQVFARRGEWFLSMAEANSVLWWVPQGHVPSLHEALERLELLRAQGPGPRAFTFANVHAPN